VLPAAKGYEPETEMSGNSETVVNGDNGGATHSSLWDRRGYSGIEL
jgi:hypothetical protein